MIFEFRGGPCDGSHSTAPSIHGMVWSQITGDCFADGGQTLRVAYYRLDCLDRPTGGRHAKRGWGVAHFIEEKRETLAEYFCDPGLEGKTLSDLFNDGKIP